MKTGPKPRPEAERFWEKVEKTESCWLWRGQIVRAGYGSFNGADRKKYFAHRWAYEQVNGPIPDDLILLHSCDIRHCVNPDHLSTGSYRDNTHDMMERKRYRLKTCKISKEIADQIRKEPIIKKYGHVKRLCIKYGLSRNHVARILRGESWTA